MEIYEGFTITIKSKESRQGFPVSRRKNMKNLIKKIITWFLIISIVAVIGYLFLSNSGKGKEETKEKYNINLENTAVVFPVKVMKVEKKTFVRWIKSNGIVKSSQEAEIYPQISGRITNSYIKEGTIVNKNAVLLDLDDREYKIALYTANDGLILAQIDYLVLKSQSGEIIEAKKGEKIKELSDKYLKAMEKYENGEINIDAYLKIKNEYELTVFSTGSKKDTALQSRSGLLRALNEFKRAELNYSYTKIRAPFSGLIADYDLSVGGYITPGKAVCKIVDAANLKVIVGVLESDVKMLTVGREADIIIPALGEEKYRGKIISVSPIIDPEKKTCKVEVGLSNPNLKIKPGMYANCIIEGEVLPNRLLIPKKALLVRNERKLVFTVLEDKAQWVYVTTGLENEEYIEILSGLNVGDILIIDGHYTLSHNASVAVGD
jgi:RND family efflux transporter MFP subunit